MKEEQIEELLIMASEKGIMEDTSVVEMATAWAALKRRRIQISSSLPFSPVNVDNNCIDVQIMCFFDIYITHVYEKTI